MPDCNDYKNKTISFYNSTEFDLLRGQANQETQSFQAFKERVLKRLPKSALVLDWGCGNSKRVHLLLSGFDSTYMGVDFSYRQIEIAAQKSPEHRYLLADFTEYPFSQNHYDLIMMRNSYHQLYPSLRQSTLIRAHSFLKVGGFLLIEHSLRNLEKEPHGLPILEFEECLAFFNPLHWKIEDPLHDSKSKTWLIFAIKQEPSKQ